MKKFNWKGVSKEVWVRVIAMFLVWINLISVHFFGFELIPYADEQIYEGVSILLTVVITFWTAWKNNSFTYAGQEADKRLEELKKEK